MDALKYKLYVILDVVFIILGDVFQKFTNYNYY